jgi:hypothetical protein
MKRLSPSSKTKQLASLGALGASAIAITGGKAEATTIISSGILNYTVAFDSDATPSGNHTVATHVFNTFVGGPNFSFRAVSTNFGNPYYHYYRHILLHAGTRSTAFGGGPLGHALYGAFPFAADGRWDMISGYGGPDIVALRGFGTSAFGTESYTDKYLLFKFTSSSTTIYGWIEASLSLTSANSSAAADGPNVTIIQYAYDPSGALITAGDSGASTPEPASIAETGLAALILGAEGLRRWRKARKTHLLHHIV